LDRHRDRDLRDALMKTIGRRRLLLVASAVAALVAAASVALAALPGLARVTETGPFDSKASKSVTTGCPPGKKLVGAGGRIRAESGPPGWIGTLQSGQVALKSIFPSSPSQVSSVAGIEVTSTLFNWAVQSYGVCATTTAEHELQHVRGNSAIDSITKKVATATCPRGKKVIGAGGTIRTFASGTRAPGSDKVLLTSIGIAANAPLGFVTATGEEIAGGTTDDWFVSAVAVCAAAAAVPGLEYKSAATPVDSIHHKYTYLDCPAGKKVVGAAGGIGAAGTAGTGEVALTGIAIHGGPTPRVSAFGAETGNGTTDTWNVTAIAICATP
jgi:hypothetical protein